MKQREPAKNESLVQSGQYKLFSTQRTGTATKPFFHATPAKRGVSVPVGGVTPGQQSSEALPFAHMNDLYERFLLDE